MSSNYSSELIGLQNQNEAREGVGPQGILNPSNMYKELQQGFENSLQQAQDQRANQDLQLRTQAQGFNQDLETKKFDIYKQIQQQMYPLMTQSADVQQKYFGAKVAGMQTDLDNKAALAPLVQRNAVQEANTKYASDQVDANSRYNLNAALQELAPKTDEDLMNGHGQDIIDNYKTRLNPTDLAQLKDSIAKRQLLPHYTDTVAAERMTNLASQQSQIVTKWNQGLLAEAQSEVVPDPTNPQATAAKIQQLYTQKQMMRPAPQFSLTKEGGLTMQPSRFGSSATAGKILSSSGQAQDSLKSLMAENGPLQRAKEMALAYKDDPENSSRRRVAERNLAFQQQLVQNLQRKAYPDSFPTQVQGNGASPLSVFGTGAGSNAPSNASPADFINSSFQK